MTNSKPVMAHVYMSVLNGFKFFIFLKVFVRERNKFFLFILPDFNRSSKAVDQAHKICEASK